MVHLLVQLLALLVAVRTLQSQSSTPRFETDDMVKLSLNVSDAYVILNGVGSIQSQIFGVTSYEGGSEFDCPAAQCPTGCPAAGSVCCHTPQDSEHCSGTQWLREWGVHSVGMPTPLGWFLPAGNLTEENITEYLKPIRGSPGWDKWHGQWPGTHYPWGSWIPNIRAGGAVPFLYLLSGVNGDPGNADTGPPPRNATLWGVAAAALTNLARTSDPQLRYVHIGNEPNVKWWATTKNCSCGATPTQCTCQPFADFFTEAATVLIAVGETAILLHPLSVQQVFQYGWRGNVSKMTVSPTPR
jgi:hypothetical protein